MDTMHDAVGASLPTLPSGRNGPIWAEMMMAFLLDFASRGLSRSEAMAEANVSYPTIRKWEARAGVTLIDGRAVKAGQIRLARIAAAKLEIKPKFEGDALLLGKAGEHLACADLLSRGFEAYLSDQGLPYDLIVDHGRKLYRVQVKTCSRPKNSNAAGRSPNMVYQFGVRRRGKLGKGISLSESHCDAVALVGLQDRAVAYFPISEVSQTMALFPPGYAFHGRFKRTRRAAIDGFPPERVFK